MAVLLSEAARAAASAAGPGNISERGIPSAASEFTDPSFQYSDSLKLGCVAIACSKRSTRHPLRRCGGGNATKATPPFSHIATIAMSPTAPTAKVLTVGPLAELAEPMRIGGAVIGPTSHRCPASGVVSIRERRGRSAASRRARETGPASAGNAPSPSPLGTQVAVPSRFRCEY